MKSNTIILVVAGLIVAAGLYWYLSGSDGNDAPLTVSSEQNESEIQFQTLVGELSPISFDTGIFSDTRFMALVDLATPVIPEVQGRIDPFAAVSSAPSAVAAGKASSTPKTGKK